MSKVYERLLKCYQCFKEKIDFTPKIALILGSGLGDYAEQADIKAVLDYKDIEGFPVSTAPGHKGRFVFGYVGGVPVVIMQGRVHYYEGYSCGEISQFLGIPNATVRTRLRRGREQLKTDLQEANNDV